MALMVNSNLELYRITKTFLSTYYKALSIDADVYHFHDSELLALRINFEEKK